MNISSKTWKWAAKHYRDFYNLTLQQARDWQTKSFKQADEIKVLTAINAQLLEALEAVEWIVKPTRDRCPWCMGVRPDYPYSAVEKGHSDDCLRQAAIRAEDEIANQKKVTTD